MSTSNSLSFWATSNWLRRRITSLLKTWICELIFVAVSSPLLISLGDAGSEIGWSNFICRDLSKNHTLEQQIGIYRSEHSVFTFFPVLAYPFASINDSLVLPALALTYSLILLSHDVTAPDLIVLPKFQLRVFLFFASTCWRGTPALALKSVRVYIFLVATENTKILPWNPTSRKTLSRAFLI